MFGTFITTILIFSSFASLLPPLLAYNDAFNVVLPGIHNRMTFEFRSEAKTLGDMLDDLSEYVIDFCEEYSLNQTYRAQLYNHARGRFENNRHSWALEVASDGRMQSNILPSEHPHPMGASSSESLLTIITAFFDIGRASWDGKFTRSVEEYTTAFQEYQRLPYKIILFMDDRHLDKIREWSRLTIVPINQQWLEREIWAWQQLEVEREIMASEQYKALISQRLDVPETHIPEYNVINHAKIDFVCYAISQGLVTSKWVSWSDFGHYGSDRAKSLDVYIPKEPLNFGNIKKDRITFGTLNKLDDRDGNITYTLQEAPEKILGSFFITTSEVMPFLYQLLYHTQVRDFHQRGIADDDQHIVLRCMFAVPSLFDLRLQVSHCQQLMTFSDPRISRSVKINLPLIEGDK